MDKSNKNVKKDIAVILAISFTSAVLYIAFERMIMDYGRDLSHSLFSRFLPVFFDTIWNVMFRHHYCFAGKWGEVIRVWSVSEEYPAIACWLYDRVYSNSSFSFCYK